MPYLTNPFIFISERKTKRNLKIETNVDRTNMIVPCFLVVTALQFTGMALCGEPPKGVLYWGGHNLVSFPSLTPPLRL